MKNTVYLILLSILALSGCQDRRAESMKWDISPVVISVMVADAEGADLLNPTTPNALDTTKIKALYRGQEYECKRNQYAYVASRAYLPHFNGLMITKYDHLNLYILQFGELDGEQSYSNESLTII